MPTGELDKLLRKIHREEPVPDFEETWSRAEARLIERSSDRFTWHRILVPATTISALVGITIAIFALIPKTGDNSAAQDSPATIVTPAKMLADITDLTPWTDSFDGLGTEWDFDTEFLERANGDKNEEESAVALSKNTLGDDTYESSTDFLLNIEIPAWNGAEKRNVL
ncbi:MAG: hypothetical protein GY847_36470 [Proteobacteria bacterium]|nr:hypothetical protein [Pseudomonadota bacterium]